MKNKKTILALVLVGATLLTATVAYTSRENYQNHGRYEQFEGRGDGHHGLRDGRGEGRGQGYRAEGAISLRETEDRLLKEHPGAYIKESEHKYKDGKNYYKIELEQNGQECKYKIDANTGEILEQEGDLPTTGGNKTTNAATTKGQGQGQGKGNGTGSGNGTGNGSGNGTGQGNQNQAAQNGKTAKITLAQAKAAALKDLPQGKILEGKLHQDTTNPYYELKIEENQKRYLVKVDANSGKVFEKKAEN